MMTLAQTTQLYAAVLRQLLPVSGYDLAPNTYIDTDIQAHARVLAQTDLDAKRLLNVICDIPTELVNEYETEYGLPLQCSLNVTRTIAKRIQIIKWVKSKSYGLAYYQQLFMIFGIDLVSLVKPKPLQCTAPCTSAVNTEQLRYKIKLGLRNASTADLACIFDSYFPAILEIDVVHEV